MFNKIVDFLFRPVDFNIEHSDIIIFSTCYFIMVILTLIGFNVVFHLMKELREITKKYLKSTDKLTIDKWFTLDYNNSYYLIEINGKKDTLIPLKYNNDTDEFEKIENEEEIQNILRYIKNTYEL